VEFGTHEELMALQGRYSYLYGLQTDALADDTASTNMDKDTNGEVIKEDHKKETTDDDVAVKVSNMNNVGNTPDQENGSEMVFESGVVEKLSIPGSTEA
jgi:hypothetical protein